MGIEEDIQQYLPRYLSADSRAELLAQLQQFPANEPQKYYSNQFREPGVIYQGDALSEMLYVQLPSCDTRTTTALVISNSCDIDPRNERFFDAMVCYCPLIELARYEALLREKRLSEDRVASHLSDVKSQRVTNIIYFPVIPTVGRDHIVFLDRINSMDNDQLPRDGLAQRRIFSLSSFGHYLFLFKLSVHFTRIQEGIDRSST